MKKSKCAKIVFIIVFLVATVLLLKPTYAYKAVVTTETLYLRSKESADSTSLDALDEGDKIEVLSENGEWAKVQVNGKTGYVNTKYIKKLSSSTSNTDSNTAKNTTTNTVTNTTTNTIENTVEPTNTTVSNEPQSTASVTDTNKIVGSEQTVSEKATVFITPLINSKRIGSLAQNSKAKVISIVNGWTYVEGNDVSGWIRIDKLSIKEQQGTTELQTQPTNENANNNVQTSVKYINDDTINMRENASTDSKVISKLSLNTEVTVIEKSGEWYKVQCNDQTGYILATLLSDSKKEVTKTTSRSADFDRSLSEEKTSEERISENSNSNVVDYAKKYIGCKYVYAASGPSTFDCSGFTLFVMKKFGISLPHTATGQSKLGTYVAKSNLQPGDLIIFRDSANSEIGHVGMYIGNNSFIHASSGSGCVTITSLSKDYYATRYVTARRVLK